MRRSLSIALIGISALIVVSSTLAPLTSAAHVRLGVRTGDWIEYSVSYYSTSPDFPESEYASDSYNRVRVEVIAIVGTNVTLRITYFYPDNVSSLATWSGDISKYLCDYLITAGLGVGDTVFTEDWRANFGFRSEITVSDTINMTVLGAQRYVNIVEPYTLVDAHGNRLVAMDAEVILFFDKTTGILVESYRSSLMFGWMVERITSTTVSFSAHPADSVWLWLGIGFAAVMGVVIAADIVKATKKRP